MKFSFDWFKSQKQKEIQKLKEENDLLMEKARLQSLKSMESNVLKVKKPYLKLKLVNDIITIVLENGEIFSKKDCTIEDFNNIRLLSTADDIINYFRKDDQLIYNASIYDREKPAEIQINRNHVDTLVATGEFHVKENSVYMNGISRSLPSLLLSRFYELVASTDNYEELAKNDEYIGLKRFFMWSCLNPRAEVADSLYEFLMKNEMKITKQGFFVALRNVVKINKEYESGSMSEAISGIANKVRSVWKKKISDFTVYFEDGELGFCKNSAWKEEDGKKLVGNLAELYENLSEMEDNRYTDSYTRTFDIRIGRAVSMPMEKCNWSTQDCAAAGLHFAGHTAPYVLCGDTTVLMLINPMKVVGIGQEKGRCYEYFPFMSIPYNEAAQIMESKEFDFLQTDELYAIQQLENLEEIARKGFVAESQKYEFNLSAISTNEIKAIVSVLDKMKQEISHRIVPVQ